MGKYLGQKLKGEKDITNNLKVRLDSIYDKAIVLPYLIDTELESSIGFWTATEGFKFILGAEHRYRLVPAVKSAHGDLTWFRVFRKDI